MTRIDSWGLASSANSDDTSDRLDQAVLDLCFMTGDPAGSVATLLVDEPGWRLPRAMAAYLDLYAQTTEGNHAAGQHLVAALDGPPHAHTERERVHLQAGIEWLAGQLSGALHTLTAWLESNPRDLLALRVAQDLAFFTGDRPGLAAPPTQALHAWSHDETERGLVSGMAAFGLCELGRYEEAEFAARDALADNPADPWAAHALAHVHEMQGRPSEGATTLFASSPQWGPSFFASHNWWHLALFAIADDDIAAATGLLFDSIDVTSPTVWFEAVNQVSLRWRLSLLGHDLALPAELVEVLISRTDQHLSVFNDLHAVCGLSLAGERDARDRLIAGYHSGTPAGTDHPDAAMLLQGFADFADGNYARATLALTTAQDSVPSIGGSIAQRDIVNQTLLVALVNANAPASRVMQLIDTHPTRWSSATTARVLSGA